MKKKNKRRAAPEALNTATPKSQSRHLTLSSLFLFVLAGLTTATLVYPGEILSVYGSGHVLGTLWFATAAIHALCRLCGWMKIENSGAETRYEKIARVALNVFFGCVLISVLYHLLPGKGSIRYGLNSLMIWLSFGAMFYLYRNLLRGRGLRRAFTAILLGMGLSQAVLGCFQQYYEIPRVIRDFENDPETQLAELARSGMDISADSSAYTLLVNRIRTSTPSGTYPLTNSFAGLLAPLFTLLCGVTIFGCRRDVTQFSFLRPVIGLLLSGLCAYSLFLTQSRTALLAAFVGMGLLTLLFFDALASRYEKYRRARRSIFVALGILSVASLVAVFILFQTKLAETGPLAGAKRSLGFRLEYWQSSLMMIRENPLLGCGPGNFKQAYTKFKLPVASEEIADPHNFVMEIASTVGIPGLLAFCVFLGSVFVSVRFSSHEETSKEEKPPKPFPDEFFFMSPIFTGALCGIFGVLLSSYLTDFPVEIVHVILLGVSFLTVILPTYYFARSCDADAQYRNVFASLIRIAVLVLLVNFLAAGGIAYTSVSLPLWFFLAVLSREDEREKIPATTEKKTKTLRDAGIFVALALCCHFLVYQPCFQASAHSQKAREATSLNLCVSYLERAAKSDPFSAEIQMDLARMYFRCARSGMAEQWLHKAITTQETALRLAPISATLHLAAGNDLLAEYLETKNKAMLPLAIKRYEKAVTLYPNHAKTRAPLAYALFLHGERQDAFTEALRAKELDETIPHEDQKLPEQMRRELDAILANE